MQLIEGPEELRSWCDGQRAQGQRLGLVPTMGALHEGHLSLMQLAARRADRVAVSIFVNPLQFGPQEDLSRYPRDTAGDLKKCEASGCDVAFVPAAEDFYPAGFQTHVDVERVSQGLCGARRPGHFRGVCTVVAKLFSLAGPCVAVFGQKDYQQLVVIRTMAADLGLPVEVVDGPTVREADGLAMSSRNAYLTAAERHSAGSLYRALKQVEGAAAAGELDTARLADEARATIESEPATQLDYLAIRERDTLAPLQEVALGRTVVLVAAKVGATRLIDNLLV